MATPYINVDTEGIDDLAKELGQQIDARVTIIDEDGWVIGDSESDPTTMENHADRPEVVEALSGAVGVSTRYSLTLGYHMMYVAVPVVSDGATIGAARVALPLTAVSAYLAHVKYVTAIAAAIASALAIVVALLIARVTTNPVRQLTLMSRRIAEGELDQRIRVSSRDEIGELAHTFNQMSARLKEMVTLISGERDKMSAILSNMADGALIIDGQGKVSMVNDAAKKILKLTEQEMVSRSLIEVIRDHELASILTRCMESGEQQSGQAETEPDRKFLRMTATPVETNGETGCLIILQDLTELRRLETVRRDFVSNISHELRTPLASIKALTETLQEGAIADRSVAHDFLERLNVEVDKLEQMVQELGQLSRIESGEVTFNMESIEIGDVIGRVSQRLRPQADRAGLNIETDCPATLPQALVDREQVEYVLLNILHNAIKFTPHGGKIKVSANIRGDALAISVADTGVGIPSEDISRIFERFYKADRARAGGGTGLGLAIAKHIVHAHSGQIWVESVEGKGSTFTFTLPLASKHFSKP
jgi:two-component system phosphate regulon sensor histidine kinase PhoR